MRRNKEKDPAEYIKVRMSQLLDESEKCNDVQDRMWYIRCASELSYVLVIMENKDGTG